MANIREYRDKNGKLISYYIKVYRGRDREGKQLKPYSTTFKVDPEWSEKRAKREAQKFSFLFEEECKKGNVSISDITLGEYMIYTIELKKVSYTLKYVFSNEYVVIPPDSVVKYLRRLERKYDLPHLNCHAFRHTMASMLYSERMDPVSISNRLGHARVSITSDIYAHKINGQDEKNVKTLEKIYFVEK